MRLLDLDHICMLAVPGGTAEMGIYGEAIQKGLFICYRHVVLGRSLRHVKCFVPKR